MNFAERLRELRNENQCTQRTLANYLGLTPNSVCEWENKRSEPSLTSLYKMANYFGVSVDYLLGLEDDFGVRSPTTAHSSTLTDKEQAMLSAFRELMPETQDFVLRTAQSLKDKRDKLGAK